MDLSNLKAAEGSVHSGNFRRGRGHGSGNGKMWSGSTWYMANGFLCILPL